MKKFIATAIAAAVVFAAFLAPSAEAGKRRPYKRTAKDTYQLPSHGQGDVGYGCAYDAENCATFATGRRDKFVKMSVTDATGNDVYFVVNQPDGPDEDTFTEDVGSGCGKSAKLMVPQAGQELIVYVPAVGSFLEGCPGPATTGTVKAVFTDR